MTRPAGEIRQDDIVVDVDVIAALIRDYYRLNSEANTATKRAEQLKTRIRGMLSAAGASVGRVSGIPVVFHRSVNGFVDSTLKKEHPDLVDAYTVTRTVEVTGIDWERLTREKPMVAEQCRKRVLTLDRTALDQTALMGPGEIVPGVMAP